MSDSDRALLVHSSYLLVHVLAWYNLIKVYLQCTLGIVFIPTPRFFIVQRYRHLLPLLICVVSTNADNGIGVKKLMGKLWSMLNVQRTMDRAKLSPSGGP